MLRYLLEKEFKQFFRNSFLPRLVVALPFVAMLIFPLAANFDIDNINLSVIDNDKSTYSNELIQKIQSSGYFRITNVSSNYEQAITSIEVNDADVIIEIPAYFERDLVKEGLSHVMISANAVNGTKGGFGSIYLVRILTDFNDKIRTDWLQNPSQLNIPSFEMIPQFWYNPSLLYLVFIIPALMVMMLAIVTGFLPALNIVGEKQSGTIEQINVTPVGKFTFILSKLIPYWIIGYVVLTVCILVARFVYGLVPIGNVAIIYLFVSIFVLAFSGFGLVISNYATTVQQAMLMMFFFVMTFIFMSGLYTPILNMPPWAQLLSNYSPLKYIIMTLRLVYLKGSTFSELLIPFAALSSFAIFFNTWAVLSYQKKS